MEWVFWALALIVAYAYVGYGILLALVVRVRRSWSRPAAPRPIEDIPDAWWPPVTLLVAAYNEEAEIPAKLANCHALDYPADRLELLFVADGSTDGTRELLERDPAARVAFQPERRGKIAALNRAVPLTSGQVLVFSDANSEYNPQALKYLARHFADPKVGCVAGEKRIKAVESAAGQGEGLYWRYESALKRLDSELVSAVGAAGEIFALRRELYEAPQTDMLIEDFVLSLRVAMRGYRIAYEPQAVSFEAPSASVAEEFKRRVRICAGGWQAIGRLEGLWNPFRHGRLAWAYVSHRVLRWTIVPLALPVVFALNVLLAATVHGWLYPTLAWAQVLLYGASLVGWWSERRGRRWRLLFVPYYLVMLNVAALAGLWRIARGRQSVAWVRARRARALYSHQPDNL